MNIFNYDKLFVNCYRFKFTLIDKIDKKLKVITLLDNKEQEIGKIEIRVSKTSCKIIYKGLVAFVLVNNDSYELVKTVYKRSPIRIDYELYDKLLNLNSTKDLDIC